MFSSRSLRFSLVLCLVALLTGPVSAGNNVLVDGDFETCRKGAELRRDDKGQDWYESRKDGEGRELVKLSTRRVGGNATHKAMIKADADLNTYLSQRFPEANWRELSMGMTDDFEVAIEEGATMVRIGRAIFGSRRKWQH